MDESESAPREAISAWAALASLFLGYGTFAAIALRFLYPTRSNGGRWQFVAEERRLRRLGSMPFTTPSGATIMIACQGESKTVADFVALSSTCPHLGCKVHWEPNKDRFFCPCHNGAFDPSGAAISGPPAESNQSLPRFALDLRDGLVFIQLPESMLAEARPCGITSPGHDACLGASQSSGKA